MKEETNKWEWLRHLNLLAMSLMRSDPKRCIELIKEYLDDLSDSDQRVLYEKLKGKFETQKPERN